MADETKNEGKPEETELAAKFAENRYQHGMVEDYGDHVCPLYELAGMLQAAIPALDPARADEEPETSCVGPLCMWFVPTAVPTIHKERGLTERGGCALALGALGLHRMGRKQ